MDRKLESCSKPSTVRKNPCLKTMMEKLFEKRSETGDIKFIVDGEVIHAHRCILAALSPRYEAQFYGAMAEKDTINVEDVSPAAFKEFLQFFYTDDVTLTLNNIEDVLNLAKQSLVDELIGECINYLIDLVGLDKIVWCYRLALDYDIEPVQEFCVKHIAANIKTVLQSMDFLSCERDVLSRILDFESLNCKETELFDACIAWARAKCEHDCIDATDTANLRMALGEAVLKIRFCSMKADEFANISRQYAGVLSAQESVEIFQAIVLKANGIHSSTFGDNNSKIREPVQPSLECSLANGPRIPFPAEKWSYIALTTDKTIMLKGLILCNKIDDDICVTFKLVRKELKYPNNTKSTSKSETIIMFDQAIQVEADERYFLTVESEGFKQPSASLHGFELVKQITQNGVSFAIIQGTNPNLIERLLFDIVDKS